MSLKQLIYSAFNEQLSSKISIAELALVSAKLARNNETKSSAGDKYETGRELMQFEIDKQNIQLNQLKLLHAEFSKINLEKKNTQATFGSLVLTNQGNYFLSVSLGKVVLNSKSYYAISLVSPLGKSLLAKSVGDSFFFQEKEFRLLSIV